MHFRMKCLLTLAHSYVAGRIWYEYLSMVRIREEYPPEILLVTHIRYPSMHFPIFITLVAAFMWVWVFLAACRRDREDA